MSTLFMKLTLFMKFQLKIQNENINKNRLPAIFFNSLLVALTPCRTPVTMIPTENILPRQDQQEGVGTSTMVDPQVSRMHTAKKMLRGCGGTEGKTNELITVTWRRKPDTNVCQNCICLLVLSTRSFAGITCRRAAHSQD